MKLKTKYFIILLFVSIIFILPGCSQKELDVKTISILKDNVEIEEMKINVDEKYLLSAKINDDIDVEVVWQSSNPEIININNSGEVSANSKGNVIISVYIKDYPYISDSIYVTAIEKVEQKGVGKGLSKNDPIFIGNEGDDEPIEVYFIEMQHIYADSIYIKKGNVDILIDSGYSYDGNYVDQILSQYCSDKRLDLLMFSHSDEDHIDGAKNALKNIENVSMMIDYGGVGGGNVLDARKKLTSNGTIYHSAIDCVNKANGASNYYYLTEDFYFQILNTGNYLTASEGPSASNPHSVAVIFYYKDFSFFTAGDITTSTEADLLKKEDLPEVTLYKASHHGSHGSNSQDLLNTLNPKAVAISAARADRYQDDPGEPSQSRTYNLNAASGHPAAAAIERIYKAPNISKNLNVYWNAVNGTMKFTSYGENDFVFSGSPTKKGYYDLSLTNNSPVWDSTINDFKNKVTGEENYKFHQTKAFVFRDYIKYLPDFAKKEYYS